MHITKIRSTASLLLAALCGLTSCAKSYDAANVIAEYQSGNVCAAATSRYWETLYKAVDRQGGLPLPSDIATEVRSLSAGGSREALQVFSEVYKSTYGIVQKMLVDQSRNEYMRVLAQLELGIDSGMETLEARTHLSTQLLQLQSVRAKSTSVSCPGGDSSGETDTGHDSGKDTGNGDVGSNPPGGGQPAEGSPVENPPVPGGNDPVGGPGDSGPIAPSSTLVDYLKQSQPRAIYGAWKSMATAYQRCDLLDLPPMTIDTPNLEGVSIVGTHPSGGKQRLITNLKKVQATHYYLQKYPSMGAQCFNVLQNPLIYDFGGKPYASSAANSTLDFFRDSGSGTKVLGTDCSGFIFSSLISAGMRIKKNTPNRAVHVYGIGAAAFANPSGNGLTCIEKVKMSGVTTLHRGDIVANSGHVVMIDTIGRDPFGITKITKVQDCTTAKLPYLSFDFNIIQSSPSKGGIGINRHRVKDYLAANSGFRDGFIHYAIQACKSQFTSSGLVDKVGFSIVRHKNEAACFDAEIMLGRQTCLDSCRL